MHRSVEQRRWSEPPASEMASWAFPPPHLAVSAAGRTSAHAERPRSAHRAAESATLGVLFHYVEGPASARAHTHTRSSASRRAANADKITINTALGKRETARLWRKAVDPRGDNAIRRRCERLSIYVIPDRGVVVSPGELFPRSALTAADRRAAEHGEVSGFEELLAAALPAAALTLWETISSRPSVPVRPCSLPYAHLFVRAIISQKNPAFHGIISATLNTYFGRGHP